MIAELLVVFSFIIFTSPSGERVSVSVFVRPLAHLKRRYVHQASRNFQYVSAVAEARSSSVDQRHVTVIN